MKAILWEGTVDNLELGGIAGGNDQPMRVVEDAGRLYIEFAGSRFTDESETEVAYTEDWYADYQMRFRDPQPPIPEELRERLLAEDLVDA